jgi:hypothetical protein
VHPAVTALTIASEVGVRDDRARVMDPRCETGVFQRRDEGRRKRRVDGWS